MPGPVEQSRKLQILIVEDDADMAETMRLVLEKYSSCDIAEHGVAALEQIAARWDSDSCYDVILLDLMMPQMDGLETLERLRHAEEERGLGGVLGAKVVILTALEDEETVTRAVDLGCEGYVFKTQGPRAVIAKLKELGLIV
ncbi:MAG: response regulator [Bdellovibrionales bacterium]|nr:response regulator [Bdellovibrionales bacterium]